MMTKNQQSEDEQLIKFEQILDIEDIEMVEFPMVKLREHPTFDDLVFDQESNSSSALSAIRDDLNQAQMMRNERTMDLNLLLSSVMESGDNNIIDELNTPTTFDVAAAKTAHLNNLNDNLYGNPFNFPVRVKFEDDELHNQQQRHNDMNSNNNNLISNNNHIESTSVLSSDLINTIGAASPNNADAFTLDDINVDEYDFLSDYNEAIFNELDDVKQIDEDEMEVVVETEDTIRTQNHHNYALRLNLDTRFIDDGSLQTPDVINTICSIERDYKIYNHAIQKQPEEIKLEIICQEDEAASPDPSAEIEYKTLLPQEVTINKRTRRRRYDSDDEEYIPPVKQPLNKRRRKVVTSSSESSSDDSDDFIPAKILKRGRPSKANSVSSDQSESSKYREMRDKNNEASRKSRQKRKLQDIAYEAEQEKLMMHNIKLKAQVEELEKTVNRFRSAFVQIVAKK